MVYRVVLETLGGTFCAVLCWRLTALNDEGIQIFEIFNFFVLKSDFIIKRLIELTFVLLIF